ncbi:MAG TPA: hypothetical protein VGD67_26125 [Pseudonocardiaceae bacterium]
MASLYTKNGVPLTVRGDQVFNPSGRQFGRIQGSKVFGSNGRYVGTIVGDRLVYRSTESAAISSPFAPSASAGSAIAHSAGSGLWGDEPDIDG